MYKKLVSLFILVLISFFAVSPALAQFGLDVTGKKAQYGESNVYDVVGSVVGFVLSLAGLVFLAIMFYAGLRWMTARGNEEFIEKAKNAMFGALMGFILVTASYGLSVFIFSRLAK